MRELRRASIVIWKLRGAGSDAISFQKQDLSPHIRNGALDEKGSATTIVLDAVIALPSHQHVLWASV